MALTTGTVTGRFEDTSPGAETITGTVYFVAEADYLLSPDSTVLPKPVAVALVNSAFSVALVATDDPTLNPVDWTYRVAFDLKADGSPIKREPFSIKVPAGVTTDLATVAPVAASAGNAILRGEKGDPGISGNPLLTVNTVTISSGVFAGQSFNWTKDANKVTHIWGSLTNTGGTTLISTTALTTAGDARFKSFNGTDFSSQAALNNANNSTSPGAFYISWDGRFLIKFDQFTFSLAPGNKVTFDFWYTTAI